METVIAYCGLICDSCPIHRATLEPDESLQRTMRESIAELCRRVYGLNLEPEDITACDGCCTKNGRLFSECLNCMIRQCATGKNIESCAFCNDYVCGKLEKHYSHDAASRTRLEEIRRANRI